MLQAQEGIYTDSEHYAKGSTVKLYASIPTGTYVVKVYNLSLANQLVFTSSSFTGARQSVPSNAYATGCNWQQSKSFVIPPTWSPGLYAAEITTSTKTYGTRFIVTEPVRGSHSRMVMSIAFNTMQAYNAFGGKSLYDYNSSDEIRSPKVSYVRPLPYKNSLDLFMMWEIKLLEWFASQGIAVEFTTDKELHENPDVLDSYDVLVVCGHDEYWSMKKRRQVEQFVNGGGKFVSLSGNTCWWQVRFEGDVMVCYKSTGDPLHGVQDSLLTINWYASPVNLPENTLLGSSFRNAGYVNHGSILPKTSGYGDFAAYNSQHWVFQGTGLVDGQEFGFANDIVGYEADGALFTWDRGIPRVTGTDQTPTSYVILGISPAERPTGTVNTATMGLWSNSNNGWVFNASTTDWAHGLASDPVVSRITLNVFQRFMNNTFPPIILDWSPSFGKPALINNQSVFLSNREVSILPGDSMQFRITTERAQQFQVFLDNALVCTEPSFGFRAPDSQEHTLRIVALNPHGSSSITWNINRGSILPPSSDNIVQNPGFESGTTSWTFFTNGTGSFSAVSPGSGGTKAGRINTVARGSNVQLYQTGLKLEANTRYQLRFKGYSNSGHDLSVTLQKHTSPYTCYGLKDHVFDLTTSWGTFTVEFVTSGLSGTTNDARLRFWFAPYLSNGDVYTLDDIVIQKVSSGTVIPPSITSHPANQNVVVGQTATFGVTAQGTSPMQYQWQRGGVSIPGATSPTYAITAAIVDNGSSFRCVVTNAAGSATSASALLTVTTPPPQECITKNSGFEDGTSQWTFYTNAGGSLSAISVGGCIGTKAAKVKLNAPGSNIQLYQSGLTVRANTRYLLTFRSYSNSGHDVSVSLQKHSAPYTNYGLKDRLCNLTTNWTTHTIEFVTSGFAGAANDVRLRLWFAPFGAGGDEYYFDDITLTEAPVANYPAAQLASEVSASRMPPQNFPNPFNPTTVISYALPATEVVSLHVYDVLGQEVATLVDGEQDAGPHSVEFNATGLSSGIYFYRLTAGSLTFVRKMCLTR